MKRYGLIMILGLLAIGAMAQSGTGSSSKLSKGTVLYARLVEGLDAANAKPGDPVEVQILFALAAHDERKKPRNPMTILGHVVEVQVRSEDGKKDSKLTLALDKLLVSGSVESPVSAVIKKLETVEVSQLTESTRPTSGDDPVLRASPAFGDQPSRPLDVPTPRQPKAFVARLKGIDLSDDSARTTVISSRKHNVVINTHTVLVLRVTGPEN